MKHFQKDECPGMSVSGPVDSQYPVWFVRFQQNVGPLKSRPGKF